MRFALALLAGLAGVLVPGGGVTAQCRADAIALVVDGSTLDLHGSKVTRIPYGKDMTAWVGPPDTLDALAVTVRYRVTSADRGVRTDLVEAVPAGRGRGCWVAGLSRLHLNETGDITAVIQTRPRYLEGASEQTLAAVFLERLAAIPSATRQEQFLELVGPAAEFAAAATFADPGAVVVVEEVGQATPFAERLGALVSDRVEVTGALLDLGNNARTAFERSDQLQSTAPLVGPCRHGRDIAGLRASLERVANASEAILRTELAAGNLPWDECAISVVQAADGPSVDIVEAAVENMVRAPRLELVRSVLRAARQIVELARGVETITVPFGADLLERYTQVDLVSAYLPDVDMAHQFATATWYLLEPGADYDFSATVTPTSLLDRFGLQMGYPVGAPISEPQDSTPFEPGVLVGAIGRINGLLSVAGGVVYGRQAGARERYPYLSLNFDVSNLGPLQKLFARRDPQ